MQFIDGWGQYPSNPQELAEELLTIQMGSIDEAMDLLDNGGGILDENEQAEVLKYLELLGNTEPLVDD